MQMLRNFSVRQRILIGVLFCLAAVGLVQWCTSRPTAPTFARMTEQTLVIDPGHGGEDGGAVAQNGQAESQVNLAIALSLDQLMGFYGVPTVLTRTTDISIHDADAKTIRQKKVSDLHNRVELIEQIPNATLISIHQNASPKPEHRGLQVFYANEALSLPLAQAMQQRLNEALLPEKQRTPQKIPTSVYLMQHISCRAVLVECGFLSNPEEAALLQQRAYQMKLAMTMGACYLTSGTLCEGETCL